MQGMLTHSFQRMVLHASSTIAHSLAQSRNTTQILRCQPPKSDRFGTYAQSRCAATRSRVKIQGGLGFQDIDYRSYNKNEMIRTCNAPTLCHTCARRTSARGPDDDCSSHHLLESHWQHQEQQHQELAALRKNSAV